MDRENGRRPMDKKQQEFLVDGFLFQQEEMAEKAKREAEGIKYIKTKTSMDNPAVVLQVYNKIIEQKMFETPVGIGYLRELQEYLRTVPAIKNEEVKPIPVEEIIKQEYVPVKEVEEKQEKQRKKPNQKLRVSLVVNIVLVLIVIGMFVITMNSQHPTILNYEEKLLNKYAGWEEELSDRERQIMEKERELGIE